VSWHDARTLGFSRDTRHDAGCGTLAEANEMNQTLKLLTERYGKKLKNAGVPTEEAARFLQQIAKMILHS
jgi:hypothetical protein